MSINILVFCLVARSKVAQISPHTWARQACTMYTSERNLCFRISSMTADCCVGDFRYMDLDQYQLGFFSKQCTDALSSLGLASSDVAIFGNTLIKFFYTRCAPPVAIPSIMAPPEKQSICIAPSCPLDPMHQCAAYPNNGTAVAPLVANATLVGNITSSEIAARNSTITYVATNRGVSQRSLGLSLVASGSILLLL